MAKEETVETAERKLLFWRGKHATAIGSPPSWAGYLRDVREFNLAVSKRCGRKWRKAHLVYALAARRLLRGA